jgi:hypothetical protein
MQKSLAITLAWPETRCKQTGAWYDKPADILGISKNNYYKVGHSAIVLIHPDSKNCHYFDFGRYHAPMGYGRVRDEITDHDLKIYTKAEISKDLKLKNYQEIIDEIQINPSCHGDGQLYAGLVEIDFYKAYSCAKAYQNQGIIEYGPFVIQGTNCSRFVRSLLFNSVSSKLLKVKLTLPWTLSPTPIGIVKNLKVLRKAHYSLSNSQAKKDSKTCRILSS